MRVIRIEPGQEPELINIENTLQSLQQQVGGYIECVTLRREHVEMIVNEEGWLQNLSFNEIASVISDHQIVGTALIVSVSGEKFTDVEEYVVRICERKIDQWKKLKEEGVYYQCLISRE